LRELEGWLNNPLLWRYGAIKSFYGILCHKVKNESEMKANLKEFPPEGRGLNNQLGYEIIETIIIWDAFPLTGFSTKRGW